MDNWDEVRTAFHVARLGTVSGAAEVLGVHHATVIRHIDALEERLGAKLFQRHARGYTATEAGSDLLGVAQATDEQFAQLANRIRGRGEAVEGELIVTALLELGTLLIPGLAAFQAEHPGLNVRLLTGSRVFRLEYGEAHVAIRAGSPPDEPDNVVQSLITLPLALYGSRRYVDRHGMPRSLDEMKSHYFIGSDRENSRIPFDRWLNENVPPENVVFRLSDQSLMSDAIAAGVGLGVLPIHSEKKVDNLVQVQPPQDNWSVSLWLVTHVDLHRTSKVQAFTKFLKEDAKTWLN